MGTARVQRVQLPGGVLQHQHTLRTHRHDGEVLTLHPRDLRARQADGTGGALLRERPQLVEMIIEDCARWKDWSIAAKLLEIHASGQQPWNNTLIMKYLQACPLPDVQEFLSTASAR